MKLLPLCLVAVLAAWTTKPSATLAQTPDVQASGSVDAVAFHVRVELFVEAPYAMRQYVERSMSKELPRRLEAALGQTGDVQVDLKVVRAFALLADSAEVGPLLQVAQGAAALDKVLHLRIEDTRRGYAITGQDYDARARYLCPPARREVRQAGRLVDAGLEALLAAYSPCAEFQQVADDPDHVLVRELLRGPSTEPGAAARLREGDVLVPVLRRSEPGDAAHSAQTQVIPWTFLVVERLPAPNEPRSETSSGAQESGGPDHVKPREGENWILCRVESHSRRALGVRRRGRVEQLAITVRPQASPVTLRLHTQTEPRKPLVGCSVLLRENKENEVVDVAAVGVSDLSGEVEVSPTGQPVQMLWIKSGELLLAKVPVVWGLADTVEVPLSEDAARIRAAADLRALRTDLVDLVARRNILLARGRAAIAEGDLPLARSLASELDKLPTRAQFNQRIDSVALVATAPDQLVQSRIDRLVQETRSVLGAYLDPREISNLHSEINSAQK